MAVWGSVNYLRDAQINGQTVDQNYCYTDYCTDHVVEDITVPDYEPVPDTKYHKGDTVKYINAIQYDNGEPFSTYYDEYSVLSVSGRRVVIGIDGVTTAAMMRITSALLSAFMTMAMISTQIQ